MVPTKQHILSEEEKVFCSLVARDQVDSQYEKDLYRLMAKIEVQNEV